MEAESGAVHTSAADIRALQSQLRAFAVERDWEQFHTPKSLVLSLVAEVGELAEIFLWLTEGQATRVMADAERAPRVEHELADVFACILRLADVLRVDLVHAFEDKMRLNSQHYPVEQSRGTAAKYTRLGTAGAGADV
jgi:dCTP diphosphatase